MNMDHTFELGQTFLNIKVNIDGNQRFVSLERANNEFIAEYIMYTTIDKIIINYLVENNIVKIVKTSSTPSDIAFGRICEMHHIKLTHSEKLKLL
jgi:hypothetical protein